MEAVTVCTTPRTPTARAAPRGDNYSRCRTEGASCTPSTASSSCAWLGLGSGFGLGSGVRPRVRS
eukprot:scaffold69862_cov63-Phaeocystis_antarctica.AAC.2